MIVTVTSQKGGVGKTTTAVTVAHRLAMRNRLVLLVDRDQQLNTVDALGLRTLADSGEITPGVYETGRTGLHLYPAGASEIDLTAHAAEYDAVVVDTPPNAFIQQTTLPYADVVIIPALCESLGVRGAKATLEIIRQIAQPKYTYILPTMYRGTGEHEANLELLTDLPGAFEVAPWVPSNGYVPRFQGIGQTIWEKSGRGVNDVRFKYDTLTDWIEQAMDGAGQKMEMVTICS